MRIFEITDRNKTILAISNIDVDFDSEYNLLVKLLTLMITLRSPSKSQRALLNVEDFENRIQKFFQNKLLDKTDPDIIKLLDKLNKMQQHINKLKSQLVL